MDKKDKLKEVVDQAIASQHVPHVKLKKMGPTSVDIETTKTIIKTIAK